jgi:phosphoglucosamine mutase
MLKTGSALGGEQSGHMIFLDHATTGDGILSSLQVLDAVLSSGQPASVLGDSIAIYPQVLRNAAVNNELKHKYMNDPDIAGMIRRIEDEMHGAGRVLIRPSGTEPLVRVMLEGEDLSRITFLAEELSALIAAKLA